MKAVDEHEIERLARQLRRVGESFGGGLLHQLEAAIELALANLKIRKGIDADHHPDMLVAFEAGRVFKCRTHDDGRPAVVGADLENALWPRAAHEPIEERPLADRHLAGRGDDHTDAFLRAARIKVWPLDAGASLLVQVPTAGLQPTNRILHPLSTVPPISVGDLYLRFKHTLRIARRMRADVTRLAWQDKPNRFHRTMRDLLGFAGPCDRVMQHIAVGWQELYASLAEHQTSLRDTARRFTVSPGNSTV